MTEQYDFDLTIGQLNRLLSILVDCSKKVKKFKEAGGKCEGGGFGYLLVADKYNQQTLKHHAEDMILTGKKILENLGKECNV